MTNNHSKELAMTREIDFEFKNLSTVQVSIKEHVGLIRIQGTDSSNLINELMVAELKEVIKSFDDNPEVRVMILSSKGSNFSAGSSFGSCGTSFPSNAFFRTDIFIVCNVCSVEFTIF